MSHHEPSLSATHPDTGIWWDVYSFPRAGESMHPTAVDSLPHDRLRLLLFAKSEVWLIDPAPPNWRQLSLRDLIATATRL